MYILYSILILIVLCISFLYTHREPEINSIIKKVFHQMARWSTASTQDDNPVVAVLHANYGVGYMLVLKEITSDEDLERILGVQNIRKLFDEVQEIQNKATLNLAKHCNNIYPNTELAKYGGESI